MPTCPNGHESATTDYCDQCGTPMAGRSLVPAAAAPAGSDPDVPGTGSAGSRPAAGSTVEACPVCGTPRTGRFCEEDGYDFVLAPPVTPLDVPAGQRAGDSAAGASGPAAGATAPAPDLVVAVDVDRRYFDVVVGMGGEDSGVLAFPRFVVERRFPLTSERVLIGRSSRSRGIEPDIDLNGPPQDPGVSHAHALLLRQPDGWAVVDLGSANGTYVNDFRSVPIPAETPVPVRPGDRVFVGAWTCLTLRAR